VICDRPPPDLSIPILHVPWSEDAERRWLARGRIGLMPLSDDPWSRGKCGLKLLQYMACGIPAVASPVGVNPEILDGGHCGFLADKEEDWVEALTRLGRDAALRREIRIRARRRAEEVYSVRTRYPRFREALVESIRKGSTIVAK